MGGLHHRAGTGQTHLVGHAASGRNGLDMGGRRRAHRDAAGRRVHAGIALQARVDHVVHFVPGKGHAHAGLVA